MQWRVDLVNHMIEKKLTIIVPGLNEEARVGTTIREAYRAASRHLDAFEIIVIDDGSTDRMAEVAEATGKELGPEVSVFRQPYNQGVGAAYLKGLELARYPSISLLPGDNAFAEAGIDRLYAAVGTAKVLVGCRDNPEERIFMRRHLSRFVSVIGRFLTGKPIRDTHGLFVFPVELAKRYAPKEPSYGYHLEALSRILLRVDDYREISVLLTPAPDASSRVIRVAPLLKFARRVMYLCWLRVTKRL
jgi:glycosyltransferase involved in cell wall biosynthesis